MLCLRHATGPRWAEIATADLAALLVDHAHCEMKAASNAMSLATRWPAPPRVSRALTAIAEEELSHFRDVLGELEARQIALGPPDPDPYVIDLRRAAQLVSDKSPRGSLVDRLLVGALIEARSCERFRLLADALVGHEPRLAAFYDELFACEARHYATLVELAVEVADREPVVRSKLAELSLLEGELASRLGVRATMHG